jgi:hypothetical protein
LNGRMLGTSELDRVPSGNIQSDVPRRFIVSPASPRDLMAFALLPLSTNSEPASAMKGPNGVHFNSCLAMIVVLGGKIL